MPIKEDSACISEESIGALQDQREERAVMAVRVAQQVVVAAKHIIQRDAAFVDLEDLIRRNAVVVK